MVAQNPAGKGGWIITDFFRILPIYLLCDVLAESPTTDQKEGYHGYSVSCLLGTDGEQNTA